MKKPDDRYYVLIADLEGSRQYSKTRRLEIQILLRDSIKVANTIFQKELKCPLSFSGGDAVECLSHDRKSLLECVQLLRGLMWRIPMRFAIGEGEWSVHMMERKILCDVNQQDGEVFWNTRNMLEDAKKHDLLINVHTTTNDEKKLINKIVKIGELPSYEDVNKHLLKSLQCRLNDLSSEDLDQVICLLETFRWNNMNWKDDK